MIIRPYTFLLFGFGEWIAHDLVDLGAAFEAYPRSGPASIPNPENRPDARQQGQDQVGEMTNPLSPDRDLFEALAAIATGLFESTEP